MQPYATRSRSTPRAASCAQANRRRPRAWRGPTSIEEHLMHRASNTGAGLGPLLCGYLRRRALLQLVSHLGHTGFGAGVILLLRGSGTAHAADRLVADHDRDSTAQSQDVGDIALRSVLGVERALLKLEAGCPEHARRVCLAASHVGGLRAGLFIAQDYHHLAGAIDDGCCGRVTLLLTSGEGSFSDGLGHHQ